MTESIAPLFYLLRKIIGKPISRQKNLPRCGDIFLHESEAVPAWGKTSPLRGNNPPCGETIPARGKASPLRGNDPPCGETIPARGKASPLRGNNPPCGEMIPARGKASPLRGNDPPCGEMSYFMGNAYPGKGKKKIPCEGYFPQRPRPPPYQERNIKKAVKNNGFFVLKLKLKINRIRSIIWDVEKHLMRNGSIKPR